MADLLLQSTDAIQGGGHAPVHAGTDSLGVPEHDFSTNRNAVGPCPITVEALGQAHSAQYPDPRYQKLKNLLAQFYRVHSNRRQKSDSRSAEELVPSHIWVSAEVNVRGCYWPEYWKSTRFCK